jgi:GNAT superfamily N-acetyltransferase
MEIGSKEISLEDSRLLSFRPASSQDEAFLIAVYGSARAEELALTNWDETQRMAFLKMQFAAQLSHYREHYPNGEQLIIRMNGSDVGRLYVANIAEEIRILDITILPENRNSGIGTPIIRELMDEAKGLGKPLRIWVESFNRSLGLFEKLGFVRVDEHGYSLLMECRPTFVI